MPAAPPLHRLVNRRADAAAGSPIDAATSLYVDLLRVVAALAVVIAHANQHGILSYHLGIGLLSHEAVVVFFVVSGLVISHSTRSRHASALDYVLARGTRIYAVALPALVFSFAVAALGMQWFPELITAEEADLRASTFGLAAIFYTQSWYVMRAVPFNGAYWSLCYEVWYYAIFGLWVFAPRRWRLPAVALAAALAGPAIMVLMPVWLMGVGVLWFAARYRLAVRAGPLFWGSPAVLLALGLSELDVELRLILKEIVPRIWFLGSAQRFLTDHVVGAAIALNLVAFMQGGAAGLRPWLERNARSIKWMADRTFSIYLYHMPMTKFLPKAMATLGWQPGLAAQLAIVAGIVGLACAMAAVTERRSPALRQWLRGALGQRAMQSP
jgi:peptidoglycan/LPS O-acetylase OafA/YrhL